MSQPRSPAQEFQWSESIVTSYHTNNVGVHTAIVVFPRACVLDGVHVKEIWISRMDAPTLRKMSENGRASSTPVPHYFVVARTGPEHAHLHRGVHPVMLALVPISEGYWIKPVGDLKHAYLDLKDQVVRMLHDPLKAFATLSDVPKTSWHRALLLSRGFKSAKVVGEVSR